MSLMMQNFLLFQLGWFSCVIGGSSPSYYWVGAAVVAVVITLHLMRAADTRDELFLIAITMVLGTAWDSGLLLVGLFTFQYGMIMAELVPLWMIAMWALFATTLNVSMKWMKGRYLLAAAFGAVGGPLAYYAGHKLGAVDFSDMTTALFAVAAGWSVIMPLLMWLSEHFNGYRPSRDQVYEEGSYDESMGQ